MLNKLSDNVRTLLIYNIILQFDIHCQTVSEKCQTVTEVVYHTIYSVNVNQAVRQCQKSVKQLQK